MKIYSYRNFDNSSRGKNPIRTKTPFATRGLKNTLPVDLSLFGNNKNFVFQLLSLCLLTLGLLLGFQFLTDNSEVEALAGAKDTGEVRALNNFGRNINPEDNLELKEIVTEKPEEEELEVDTEETPEPEIQTITYTVKAGDNLYAIAQQHGVDFTDIAEDNELTRPYNLQIGQQLYINP
jgi:LysM repeat protein